jgi:MFS family permease
MARRSYVAVLISAVACYAALGAVLRTLPALTADRAPLGLLVGAPALTAVVTRPAGGRLADRVGPAPVMLGGAVAAAGVAAAGLLALSAVHGTGGALASTAVIAFGQALAVPALGLLVLARAPAERQGAAAGLFFAFFDAGVGAGGLLTGLAARATSPSGALVAASGAVACAGLSQAMMRGDTTRAS